MLHRSEQERVRWMKRRGMDPHARCVGGDDGRCHGFELWGETAIGSGVWQESMSLTGFHMPKSAMALPVRAQGRCEYAWLMVLGRHQCWYPKAVEQERRDRELQEEINRVLELSGKATWYGPRRRSSDV